MAVRYKLNDKKISAAKLDDDHKDILLGDGDGLFLRIRPGEKAWVYHFTSPISRKRRKQALGQYPTTSLEKARELAEESRRLVADGIDPLDKIEQDQILSAIGEPPRTVQDLFDRWKSGYLAHHHGDRGAYVERALTLHAFPVIGKIELANLRAQHVAAVLSRIKETGKKRTIEVVLSNMRQMLCYGVECGWLQGDPSAAIKKKTWAGPKVKRDRVLSEEELRDLAIKVPQADLPGEIECAIWIMVACMTRVEETGLARLKDVDFKHGTWRIPVENQKEVNGAKPKRDHIIFLSRFALSWFERLRQIPQERAERKNARLPKKKRLAEVPPVEVDYLFPAVKREGAINEKTISHAINDRQKPGQEPLRGRTPLVDALVLDGGKWTPHDLRRTGSTLMRELRVPQDVIDRCLNHVESDVIIATYQLAELRAEMKEAWLKLGSKLEELTQDAQLRSLQAVSDHPGSRVSLE